MFNSLRFTSKSPITFTKLCSVFKGLPCPKGNYEILPPRLKAVNWKLSVVWLKNRRDCLDNGIYHISRTAQRQQNFQPFAVSERALKASNFRLPFMRIRPTFYGMTSTQCSGNKKGLQTKETYFDHYGRIVGNKSTSRIDAASVKSMTNRSIPIPRPPVGGMPYSRAST